MYTQTDVTFHEFVEKMLQTQPTSKGVMIIQSMNIVMNKPTTYHVYFANGSFTSATDEDNEELPVDKLINRLRNTFVESCVVRTLNNGFIEYQIHLITMWERISKDGANRKRKNHAR